jgi:hypothetical protein
MWNRSNRFRKSKESLNKKKDLGSDYYPFEVPLREKPEQKGFIEINDISQLNEFIDSTLKSSAFRPPVSLRKKKIFPYYVESLPG